jgi:hypothetical protein
VYERVASVTPGMFARSSPWWQDRTLADPEWLRGGRGELQFAVLEHEERPTGYALYRMNWSFERGLQAGSVAVVEALGGSPEATAAIWRYLLDIDWLARVKAGLLPVELVGGPKILLLDEPLEGLAPIVVDNLFAALLAIRDNAGVTMILAEQKVDLALAFAEDALVLERGRIAFRGKTAELREDEALQHRLLAIGEL